jgi:hypothetical protein
MTAVSINDEQGYPCPKDGTPLQLIAGKPGVPGSKGAWCPHCHTVWREVGEVDLADLDALDIKNRE